MRIIPLTAALVATLAASVGAAQTWDVAPIQPSRATEPEVCPGGGDGVRTSDALVTLRRGVGLIPRFSCDGETVPDSIVDVAPVTSIDESTDPPTVVIGGGDGVSPVDALLILRAAVGLVQLAVEGANLSFDLGVGLSSTPLPILASDADRPPRGNFPGAEDRDDGNGVLDERSYVLIATVTASDATPATSFCAYDVDPATSPGATPLGCEPLAAFSAGDSRLVSIELAAPSSLGGLRRWLWVDDGDVVAESDEDDNFIDDAFQVIGPPPVAPDLAFAPLAPITMTPTVPFVGGSATFRARVQNVGTADVTVPFALDFLFDEVLPPRVGSCEAFVLLDDPVPAGDELIVQRVINLRDLGGPGPHNAWAVVDSGYDQCPPLEEEGDVLESNESNNVSLPRFDFCVASVNASPGDRPDLRADELVIQRFGAFQFRVSATWSSAGTRDVVPFADGAVQLPARAVLRVGQGGSRQEFEQSSDCLPIGTRSQLGSQQLFDLPRAGSTVRVELSLDPDNEMAEDNESNNSVCIEVQSDGSTDSC